MALFVVACTVGELGACKQFGPNSTCDPNRLDDLAIVLGGLSILLAIVALFWAMMRRRQRSVTKRGDSPVR